METSETTAAAAADPPSPRSPIVTRFEAQTDAIADATTAQQPTFERPLSPKSPIVFPEHTPMEVTVAEEVVAEGSRSPLPPSSPVKDPEPEPQAKPQAKPQPKPQTQSQPPPPPQVLTPSQSKPQTQCEEPQAAVEKKPSLFTQYIRVRQNLRRAMHYKKYTRLDFILNLFLIKKAAPEPDTFDLIADCLAQIGDEEKLAQSREFRSKANALRGESETDEDAIEKLESLIRTGADDLDLITTCGISTPSYPAPRVSNGTLISEVRVKLEVVPGAFLDGVTEVVTQGSEQCDDEAREEEIGRKAKRTRPIAAAAAIKKLQELVKVAKASREVSSDDEMDVDTMPATQRLHDLVCNAADTYELILSRELSLPRYRETPNSRPGFIEMELQLRLDVSKDIEADLPDRIKEVEGIQVRMRRNKTARERKLKKLRNVLATKALSALEDIAQEVMHKASARLTKDLDQLLSFWQILNKDTRYEVTLDRLEKIVTDSYWAGLYGAKATVFGSVTCGLALPDSDLDVNISLPVLKDLKTKQVKEGGEYDRSSSKSILQYLFTFFERAKMTKMYCIDSARVPVLHYTDPFTNQEVDITVCNPDGILLTKFLRTHLRVDKRIWQLTMIVKYWAKQRAISGAPYGFINPLGWTVMVIHFLQHCVTPAIAGLFCVLKRDSEHVARDANVKKVKWNSSCKSGKNKATIAELVVQFFDYYGYKFDFENDIISLSSQEPKSKEYVEKDLEIADRHATICIEQPLQPGVNIVGYMMIGHLKKTIGELRRGYYGAKNVGKGDEFLFEKKDAGPPSN